MQNGKLAFESEVGKGTTVYYYITNLGGFIRMKKTIAAFTLTAMVLTGCGAEEARHTNHEETTFQEIVVQIQTAEQLPVGEEVVLSAKVTQGEEAVDDADKVEFEVWESGMRDEGQMVEGTLTKDGVYEAISYIRS